jgi:hypothetical protein
VVLYGALALTATGWAQVGPHGPIKTNLCEMLRNPSQFNGRIVQLRAKFDSGMEFQGLLDEGCSQRIWLRWPNEDSEEAPPPKGKFAFIKSKTDLKRPQLLTWRSYPPPIKLAKDKSYEDFQGFISKHYTPKASNIICNCPLYVVTATFVGRFDFASLRAIRSADGRIEIVPAMGFGHLNGWKGQLTLQSVSQVTAEPVKAWYTEQAEPETRPPDLPVPPPVIMPPLPPPPGNTQQKR